jgi:competence protein ComEA
MINSLLLKLGMLVITMGISFWMLWSPHPATHYAATTDKAAVDVTSDALLLSGQTPKVQGSLETTSPPAPVHRLLDLNRATAVEIESLPGIGAVLAQRVIAFRESVGQFRTAEDLRAVKGIGSKKFDRIKTLVTVSIFDPKAPVKRPLL